MVRHYMVLELIPWSLLARIILAGGDNTFFLPAPACRPQCMVWESVGIGLVARQIRHGNRHCLPRWVIPVQL
jgi:hypothetical protein